MFILPKEKMTLAQKFLFKKNVTGPGKNCETCNFGNARNYCNIHNYNQLLFVHQMEFHEGKSSLYREDSATACQQAYSLKRTRDHCLYSLER